MEIKRRIELRKATKIIEQNGVCPTCYFNGEKHTLKLLKDDVSEFNIPSVFRCKGCGGIYGLSDVIPLINYEKERRLKTRNRPELLQMKVRK